MGVIRFLLHLVGWLITIILQIVVSFFVIFLFTVIFAGVDTTSRAGWLALLVSIWLGYVIGVNLVGFIAFRWVWRSLRLRFVQRLVFSMVGAVIPLLILLPIGFSVPVGDSGTRFADLVTNNWQPILAQASLFTTILAYYLPGVITGRQLTSSVDAAK